MHSDLIGDREWVRISHNMMISREDCNSCCDSILKLRKFCLKDFVWNLLGDHCLNILLLSVFSSVSSC